MQEQGLSMKKNFSKTCINLAEWNLNKKLKKTWYQALKTMIQNKLN